MSKSHPITPEGFVLVQGGAEIARDLLAAAAAAGVAVDQVTRSPIQGGYVVPTAVAEQLASAEKATAKKTAAKAEPAAE